MANVSAELRFIMDLDLPSPYKGNVRVTDPTSKYYNKIAYVGDKVKPSIIKVDPTHTWTRAVSAKASILTLNANQAGKP
ncbi:hypothetical protein PHLCEN_2v3689 [Hermanssonia centrifuga]|uniref:Uncharacterized protein n=1 Tax=Hermanssonia centrifuga TaxID=98765 RepID=A0A2R6QEF3_9APHY|nr:hypothetical protein PHLCEN_2v3689 [Hermanssonia centrifuga]